MIGDTALRNFEVGRPQSTLELSLQSLVWAGKFAPLGDADLRARFATLAKQVAALPANFQSSMRDELAAAMAAYGFVDEARALGATLVSKKQRDQLNRALACTHARRGNIGEAVASLAAIDDGFIEYDASEDMADCIARTANPDLARAVARQLPADAINERRVAEMIALTEQAAGHHEAARDSALSIKNAGWRGIVLNELAARYRRDANYAEAATTERLRRDVVSTLGESWSDRQVLESLLDDLMNLNADSEILALLDQVPEEYRAFAFVCVLRKESDPAVIREIATRLPQLSGSEQAESMTDLIVARVRTGDLEPADALALVRDQQELAKEFIRVARSLDTGQLALARNVLQAAIAAKGKRPFGFWTDVAWAQARLGLFEEAHRTIDTKVRPADARASALAGVSAAEAAQGKAEDAARSRARAAKLFKSGGSTTDDYYVAYYLMDADYPEAAGEHVLATIERNQARFAYDDLPQRIVTTLAKRGDFKRAVELANALSNHFEGTPEPFADVYSVAKGLPNMILRIKIR